MKMNRLAQLVKRFIEIDFQYMQTSLPFMQKVMDIISTDVRLIINHVIQPKKFHPVQFGNTKIFYDTKYATKTLLTTVYDFYVETRLASILPKNPVVLDIGANIGQFVVAVKSFYPRAKIYSYEPDKDVFLLLKDNASQFHNTYVFNYGLSDKNRKAIFYRSNNFSEWSSLKPMEGYEYTKTEADLKKGDDLFSKLKKIDLIKIDVEGAELEVLNGMVKTLQKSTYILLETSILRNPEDFGSNKVLEMLFKHDFYIYHIGRIFSDGKGGGQGAVDLILKRK